MEIIITKIDFDAKTVEVEQNKKLYTIHGENLKEVACVQDKIISIISEILEEENQENYLLEFMLKEKIFDMCKLPYCNTNGCEGEFLVKLLFLDKNKKFLELIRYENGEEIGSSLFTTLNSLMSSTLQIKKIFIDQAKSPLNDLPLLENNNKHDEERESSYQFLNFIN
jgi:hypothetical protein